MADGRIPRHATRSTLHVPRLILLRPGASRFRPGAHEQANAGDAALRAALVGLLAARKKCGIRHRAGQIPGGRLGAVVAGKAALFRDERRRYLGHHGRAPPVWHGGDLAADPLGCAAGEWTGVVWALYRGNILADRYGGALSVPGAVARWIGDQRRR